MCLKTSESSQVIMSQLGNLRSTLLGFGFCCGGERGEGGGTKKT